LKESEAGGWELDFEDLKRQLLQHPNTRAVFINSPHNPTGYVMNQQARRELADLCSSKHIMVFSDEVYS